MLFDPVSLLILGSLFSPVIVAGLTAVGLMGSTGAAIDAARFIDVAFLWKGQSLHYGNVPTGKFVGEWILTDRELVEWKRLFHSTNEEVEAKLRLASSRRTGNWALLAAVKGQ